MGHGGSKSEPKHKMSGALVVENPTKGVRGGGRWEKKCYLGLFFEIIVYRIGVGIDKNSCKKVAEKI